MLTIVWAHTPIPTHTHTRARAHMHAQDNAWHTADAQKKIFVEIEGRELRKN